MRSPEQQILAVFEAASELSMPFCRTMVQQIFESDSTSTEQSPDSLSATLLKAIKSALENDQTSGLELLSTLDNALTDKVCMNLGLRRGYTNAARYDNTLNARSSMRPPSLLSRRSICRV